MQDDDQKFFRKQPDEEKDKQKTKIKWLILIICCMLFLAGAIFLGYTMFYNKKETTTKHEISENDTEETILFSLDPFIVNLAEPKRFLKITLEFELKDKSYEEFLEKETARLRDVIITLLSGKSFDSLSGPEGKLQLKDEILLRANNTLGNNFFKNIYFTEFVMQ